VLAAQGEDAAWLDALRPPRALHFAGHMAVAADDAAVARSVRDLLADERVGFGYGALAAGADIVIAEALLEAGAELHLVLPADRETFRQTSAESVGADWARRFDAIVEQAESIVTIGAAAGPAHPLGVRLATEVAMGQAVMQAQRLTTEAIQLLILDAPPGSDTPETGSGLFGALWREAGRRQRILTVARDTPPAPATSRDGDALAAMLSVEMPAAEDEDELAAELLPAIARAVADAGAPLAAPQWAGSRLSAAWPTPALAARAALAIVAAVADRTEVRLGGHYGVARRIDDPFGGPPLLVGSATTLPGRLTASTPPGAVHVTDSFAAALHAGAPSGMRTEYIGDLSSDDPEQAIRLFSLKP
jgi:hypothetical protein